MKKLTCILLSFLIFATPLLAQNPCEDSTYLDLKKKKLDEMSDREYEYFIQADKFCKDYQVVKPNNLQKEEKPNKTSTPFTFTGKYLQNKISDTKIVDCYQQGYLSGENQSGSGPLLGGFGGGVLLGFIGWGVAYAMVASGNPHPSYYELESISESCQYKYREGYKQGALKNNKTMVNTGGALGTIIAILIYSSY